MSDVHAHTFPMTGEVHRHDHPHDRSHPDDLHMAHIIRERNAFVCVDCQPMIGPGPVYVAAGSAYPYPGHKFKTACTTCGHYATHAPVCEDHGCRCRLP
jgi:hypothetical protein